MREALAKMGVSVEEQQLDVLLSSVSGDDVLHLLLAADSIRKINQQILSLLQGGQGSVQSARKYTGVHMVLVDLYLQANLNVLGKIGSEYIPRLEEVMKTARRLGDEARQMLAKAGRDEKKQAGSGGQRKGERPHRPDSGALPAVPEGAGKRPQGSLGKTEERLFRCPEHLRHSKNRK